MSLDRKAPKEYRRTFDGGRRPVLGLDLIGDEQARQMLQYPPEHDDAHDSGELAAVAAALAIDDADCVPSIDGLDFVGDLVVTEDVDWMTPLVDATRHDRIHQLAMAGAFIASEIDRLLRAKGRRS